MKLLACLLTVASLGLGMSAHAQSPTLKKTLTERIPQLGKIDEVRIFSFAPGAFSAGDLNLPPPVPKRRWGQCWP